MSIAPLLRSLLLSGDAGILQTMLEDPALRSRAAEGAYEVRTQAARPGKLEALHVRFRDSTLGLLRHHGIRSLAYWTPFDAPASADTLVSRVHHEDGTKADVNRAAGAALPEGGGFLAAEVRGRVPPPRGRNWASTLPKNPKTSKLSRFKRNL